MMHPARHFRIQIPALNEAATIGPMISQSLKAIERYGSSQDTISLLVLDDGSTDTTAAIVTSFMAQDPRVLLISHTKTQGLGYSFRRGINKALADDVDIFIHIDGDGQFNPADIPSLVRPMIDDQYDMVTASRFANPKFTPAMPFLKKWGNRVFALLLSFMTGKRVSDACCGFRVFSKKALKELKLCSDFTYTHESLLCSAYSGLSVLEVPLRIRGQRLHGQSRVAANLFLYALKSTWIIFRTWATLKPRQFLTSLALFSLLSITFFYAFTSA